MNKKPKQRHASKRPRCLQDALKSYRWNPTTKTPDYAAFQNWLHTNGELAKQSIAPVHATSPNNKWLRLPYEIAKAASRVGIEVKPEGPKIDQERAQTFLKSGNHRDRLGEFKLLFSIFSNATRRQLEVYASLQSGPVAPELVTYSSTQAEHRAAFFAAVSAGDGQLAYKMIGRLRDEAHDPGELAFLEATAAFHSNRLGEAIRHAQGVSRSALDYPRAYMLEIEAVALQGNPIDFERSLKKDPSFEFPNYFAPYVCEILLQNCDHPTNAIEAVAKMCDDSRSRTRDDAAAYQLFARSSCEIITRFIEVARTEAEALELSSESVSQESDREHGPLWVQQLEAAVLFDALFFEDSRQLLQDQERASEILLKRLLNHGASDLSDYIQALRIQWRIGNKVDFVHNVMQSLPICSRPSTLMCAAF